MAQFSPRRIAAICFPLAALAAAALVWVNRPTPRPDVQRLLALERLAAFRFEHRRGLSPCEIEARDLTDGLLTYARRTPGPEPELVALIAPTFGELRLIVFRQDLVQVYRIPGQTGFDFPSSKWLVPDPESIGQLRMSKRGYQQVSMSILRHVRYPMTARERGMDGASYYLVDSRQNCAMAWHPTTSGPSRAIVDILLASSGLKSNEAQLIALAQSVDAADNER